MKIKILSLFIFFFLSTMAMSQILKNENGVYYTELADPYTGIYTEEYEDGTTKIEMELTEGIKDGFVKIYYKSGDIKEIRSYKKGLMDGTWVTYNSENVKVAEANYQDGKKHGKWMIWDDNGVLRYDMIYESGDRTGIWNIYNEKGEVISSKDYR